MCNKTARFEWFRTTLLLATGALVLTAGASGACESVPLPRERPQSVETLVSAEDPQAAAGVAPLPAEKPGTGLVVAANELPEAHPLPADKPQGAADVASPPLPETKPSEAAAPVPAERPDEAGPPVPAEKPAETTAPVPEEKPVDVSAPLPAERPGEAGPPMPEAKPGDDAGDGEAREHAGEQEDEPAREQTAPKAPLFAEDAMSPACAAIEEGRVSGRPLKPIEDPAGCVVPAVYAVSSLGSERVVTLSPEAELNCAMVDQLDRFVEEVVEPAAIQILGSELTGLGIAGSYVCRTRNGVPSAEPSEHGKANAIDISSFTMADGRVITVTADWERVSEPDAEGVAAPRNDKETEEGDDGPSDDAASSEAVREEPASHDAPADDAASGGEAEAAASEKDASDAKEETAEMRFLHEVHDKACGPFTTVIGPDGDEHHHDHFHFDLQPRGANGRTTFCQ